MGVGFEEQNWLGLLRDQNPWWVDPTEISSDPLIQKAEKAFIKWKPLLLSKIHLEEGMILTLRGPRQVGKSTLIKLLIDELLQQVPSRDICYASCDLVTSPKELVGLVQSYLRWHGKPETSGTGYLFLDEITAVPSWARSVKSLADAGIFRNCYVFLTGSNTLALQGGLELLTGRRGTRSEPMDYILIPMKFAEYISIRHAELAKVINDYNLLHQDQREMIWRLLLQGEEPPLIHDLQLFSGELFHLFNDYLITGGIVRAIQEFFQTAEIPQGTYNEYVRGSIGDILHAGKKKEYLQQILQQVFKSLTSAVGFNTLNQDIEVGSKNTVKDYIELLNGFFVLSTVYQVDLTKKLVKYRSTKKIHVQDPFIFHALHDWVTGRGHPWETAQEFLANPEQKSKLVESVVHNHLVRFLYNSNPHDLFDAASILWFWRDQKGNEVDFVFSPEWIDWVPIEVKYQETVNRSDFKGMWSFLSTTSAKRGLVITKKKWKVETTWTQIPVHFFLMLV